MRDKYKKFDNDIYEIQVLTTVHRITYGLWNTHGDLEACEEWYRSEQGIYAWRHFKEVGPEYTTYLPTTGRYLNVITGYAQATDWTFWTLQWG